MDQSDVSVPLGTMAANNSNSQGLDLPGTEQLNLELGAVSRRGHYRTASNLSNISLEEIQNIENNHFSNIQYGGQGNARNGGYTKLPTQDTSGMWSFI